MTILVPVATGPLRSEVLDTAIELAECFDQELYVVHMVDDNDADSGAKRVRDDLRAELADVDVAVTVSLEHVSRRDLRQGSRIGQEVVDIATDVGITHIVMGHRSRGTLAGLTRGSTAFSVADQASVPVTVVPESAAHEGG